MSGRDTVIMYVFCLVVTVFLFGPALLLARHLPYPYASLFAALWIILNASGILWLMEQGRE